VSKTSRSDAVTKEALTNTDANFGSLILGNISPLRLRAMFGAKGFWLPQIAP